MLQQNEYKKNATKVISFVANKGGVSKTRHAILVSNCLATAGYHVLIIDMDFNNSTTTYYLKQEHIEAARKTHNIAKLLSDRDNKLKDFILGTEKKNLDLIPSSRNLADSRTLEERRLKKIIENGSDYDFIIIDCQPTYDNITLNAIWTSDFIITPCLQDDDSFNAAVFLYGKFLEELETKYPNWFITVNGYNKRWEDAEGGKQKEYIERYIDTFPQNITPRETWLPWTADMNEIKDRKKLLARDKQPNAVVNPALYDAICNLAECFIDEDELKRPDYF